MKPEKNKHKVIVVGGGQAGLTVGYYLQKNGIPFVILDAEKRTGDTWRNRWESLKLFTPAKFDSLPGMKFPSKPNYFPTKDEMGDYLEGYAQHFKLPVRNDVKVTSLSRENDLYYLETSKGRFTSENVIIAMSSYQVPRVPDFSKNINPDIVQIHSFDYRKPEQLQEGDVLVVGAGNSGCEIALEAVKNNHKVILSGRDVGNIPFHLHSKAAKILLIRFVLRVLFHRVLSTGNPIGRKARPGIISKAGPLIRIKPQEIIDAGIERIPKIKGVQDGVPVSEDGRKLNVKNIVWSTGFYPAFSWIDIPVFKNGEPMQNRGVVDGEPGLYFTGLQFLHTYSSSMVHGTEKDARYIVNIISKKIEH